MELIVKLTVMAALCFAAGDALFGPDCLLDGLGLDLSDSGLLGGRWIRDVSSLRSRESRVRRFLWTNEDVCRWACGGDRRGRDLLLNSRRVCERCCPASATSTTPAASTTLAAATTSRNVRSTSAQDQSTAAASTNGAQPTSTPASTAAAASTTGPTAASAAETTSATATSTGTTTA